MQHSLEEVLTYFYLALFKILLPFVTATSANASNSRKWGANCRVHDQRNRKYPFYVFVAWCE